MISRRVLATPAVEGKELKQRILARRECNQFSIPAHLVSVRVDGDVPDDDERAARFPATPEERAHASQQLLKVEGLGEIVIRPAVQSRHGVLMTDSGSEHEDGHAAARRAEPSAHLETIHARKVEVEDHQSIVFKQRLVQPRLTVKGKIDTVGLCLQVFPYVLSNIALVLNDKDMHWLFLSRLPLYQPGIKMD